MIFDDLKDLNLTDLQKQSLEIMFRKVSQTPFSNTKFQTNPQELMEAFCRNLVCALNEGVNPAVVGAQMICESQWFLKAIMSGIKASQTDIEEGNYLEVHTHETVGEAGLKHYQDNGRLVGIQGTLPDGKYSILISDKFYFPKQAYNVEVFMAMNFNRYYDFMAKRAEVHGFDLKVVAKDVDAFLDFLENGDPSRGLYPYASGEGYKNDIKRIISDNGLGAFNCAA